MSLISPLKKSLFTSNICPHEIYFLMLFHRWKSNYATYTLKILQWFHIDFKLKPQLFRVACNHVNVWTHSSVYAGLMISHSPSCSSTLDYFIHSRNQEIPQSNFSIFIISVHMSKVRSQYFLCFSYHNWNSFLHRISLFTYIRWYI